jgi:hypothetical protein
MNVVPSKPNYLLEFHKHGKPVGTFDFDKDAMHFEGDLTESGKIFVDWVLGEFQERIDDAVQAEREACIVDVQASVPRSGHHTPEYIMGKRVVERIRARGEKPQQLVATGARG